MALGFFILQTTMSDTIVNLFEKPQIILFEVFLSYNHMKAPASTTTATTKTTSHLQQQQQF